ncbi:MAG TPA: branched-chain amino acid ABC transporter permease [Anaeromyxobacter sp.]|nr:branched-chain amino acid ABC transporter permease [Anaeromyxobacter sp.]
MREEAALYPRLSTAAPGVRTGTAASRAGLPLGALLLALTLSLPFWAELSTQQFAVEFLYTLALAEMWNLLAGYGGMVSIGQQLFVGLGGYTLVVLALKLGVHPLLALLVAAPVAALVAATVSVLLFRLQGPQLAVGTWVMAEVFRLLLANASAVGGGSGVSLTRAVMGIPDQAREVASVWLACLLGFGAVAAVYALLRSRFGLALTAIRDSEAASEAVGVPVHRVKFWVYVLSAAGCGLVGAMVYLTRLRISPDAAFSVDWSATMIFIVIIGGIGTIEGPIVGSIVYFALRELLADRGAVYLVVLGALAILVMLRARQGLWGWAVARFDVHLFPVRRRLVGPPPPAPEAQR